MTFWLGVAVAYVAILMIGLCLGAAMANRFPGDRRGIGVPVPRAPEPIDGKPLVDV